MTKRELYESKFISIPQALEKIQSGDTIAVGHYGNEPRNLLRQLHTIRDRVEDVTVWINNPSEEYPFVMDNSLKGKIDLLTAFYGGPLRKIHDSGRVSFAPHNMHMLSRTIIETKKPTVFMAAVTPLDEYGYVCISMSQQMEREMMEVADLVIFEVNENIPKTIGTIQIPVEKVDYFVQAEGDISSAPEYPITEVQQRIAQNVASLIRDGDTIQLGIGGLPNAMADALMDKKDLGVHTEMFSTSLYHLMDAGVVTNDRKSINRGKSICAFCWGDDEFNRYIDFNPGIQVLPLTYVNNPNTIMANDNMVSINSALEIDLTGQICSESLGCTQFSGTGGATDYAYGAFHSKGGKGIVALTSTAKHGTVSRIVPTLTPGAVVSIQRNIADYIVTEYGAVRLRHLPLDQRVKAMISIAHPDFREELQKEADRLMIW